MVANLPTPYPWRLTLPRMLRASFSPHAKKVGEGLSGYVDTPVWVRDTPAGAAAHTTKEGLTLQG